LGVIGIGEENGRLKRVWFGSEEINGDRKETPILNESALQIRMYLQGKLKNFTLPIAPEGTVFMQAVWNELCRIPYGKTVCYGDIALAIGNFKAVRAVGLANNRNPIPIIIPCHRVIGKNGKLTGYAGGLDIKQKLLDIEKTQVNS